MPQLHISDPTMTVILVISIALIAGCTHTPSEVLEQPVEHISSADVVEPITAVTRYNRYTLVELTPQPTQQDLMLQIVDISLPNDWSITVGDALRYVLQRSGFQLCGGPSLLDELPLPAAHLRIGPVTLHDALLTLVGLGWEMRIDQMARRICFLPRDEAQSSTPKALEG